MAKMYYEKDCDLSWLKGKKIAIIGYGSQGHAHALNLKDSGCDVCVGLREGSRNWANAEKAGLAVRTVPAAAEWADIVMMLINDEVQAEVYKKDIAPYMTEGKALAFAHGFNIRYQQIVPPAGVDVFMAAPKGPGHTVRSTYVAGKGVPCLVAVEQDATGHAYQIAVTGYEGRTNYLNLFDLDTIDQSIIRDGIQFDKTDIEKNLTLFLYPDDSDDAGRLLRIYQQYLMVSAGAQLILEECLERGSNLHDLYDYAAIQINDMMLQRF